jgi:hypothetical protein
MCSDIDDRDDLRIFLHHMASECTAGIPMAVATVRRARRRIALVVTCTIILAAALVTSTAVTLERIHDRWAPRPAEPGRTFVAHDLSHLVLRDRADVVGVVGGEGMPGRLEPFEPERITVVQVEVTTGVSRTTLAEAGMRTAYVGWYSTPPFESGQGGTSLVSMALLFPDRESARRGLQAFRSEGPNIWRIWRIDDTERLGDEGYRVDGRIWGTPGLAYAWRIGNVVLFLGSQGHFAVDDLQALAEEMDARSRSGI